MLSSEVGQGFGIERLAQSARHLYLLRIDMAASSRLRLLIAAVFALGMAAVATNPVRAQSVGFEAGMSGVESYDGVRPAVGVSLFLPLTERLRVAATGSQWSGCPSGGCEDPRVGYGNRGLNVLGMFTAVDGRRTDLSLGAGMGWYEMKRLDEEGSGSESYYDEALTFAAELRRDVAYNSGVYLRGEASVPTDESAARWMALRLGVDVRPF